MPVIIDGHNLRWAIQKACEEFGSITDLQLCYILGRYLKLTGERGEIVFDGTGASEKGRFDNISNLEIFYAGLAGDADSVIEDKIRVSTAPKRLTVVSSDRKVQAAARMRKATVVKSEVFWNNMGKQLGKVKAKKEPAGKRWGISESETEHWLKFFGLGQ